MVIISEPTPNKNHFLFPGIIPNFRDWVLSNTSVLEVLGTWKGVYVIGWLKICPTGIIGTKHYCASTQ
ncbi:hypothetical protein C5167_035950 [Papaver somniferum]|nr:hypothetical protein C5167_035950 [Papaver somniferum]